MDFETLDMLQDLYNKELISREEYAARLAKRPQRNWIEYDLYSDDPAYECWKELTVKEND